MRAALVLASSCGSSDAGRFAGVRCLSNNLPLPKIAPAPEFALTSQDGAPVTLADFRGKVVAVTFILTMCTDDLPRPHADDVVRSGSARAGLRREDRVRFHHRRPGARHARRAEGVCAGVRRQFRGLELSHRRSGGYSGCDAPVWRIRVEVRRMATWTTRSLRRSSIGAASCACNISACASILRNFGVIS